MNNILQEYKESHEVIVKKHWELELAKAVNDQMPVINKIMNSPSERSILFEDQIGRT